MLVRLTVVVALLALPMISGCKKNKCRDAQKHYCSKLPDFDCSDEQMKAAVSKVITECGPTKASNFRSRAIGNCSAYGRSMKCPTD